MALGSWRQPTWCEICGLVRLGYMGFSYTEDCLKKNRKTGKAVGRRSCYGAKIQRIGPDAPDDVKAQHTLLLMMGGDE